MARSQLRAWGALSLVTTAMMMTRLMVGVGAVVPGGFEEAGNSLVGAMMVSFGHAASSQSAIIIIRSAALPR